MWCSGETVTMTLSTKTVTVTEGSSSTKTDTTVTLAGSGTLNLSKYFSSIYYIDFPTDTAPTIIARFGLQWVIDDTTHYVSISNYETTENHMMMTISGTAITFGPIEYTSSRTDSYTYSNIESYGFYKDTSPTLKVTLGPCLIYGVAA